MFEKNLNIVFLLDFYGDVLDEHTKNILKNTVNKSLVQSLLLMPVEEIHQNCFTL